MYRVAVVRGGPSAEHAVSMKTGAGVLEALSNTNFQPIDIIITRDGEWVRNGKVWQPRQLLDSVDVVFLALHGAYGEDGTIQRLLDQCGIPYTGSGAYPSAIAMNKALTKDHLAAHGIKMSPHIYVQKDSVQDPYTYAQSVIDAKLAPFVVKPVCGGSSIDTHIVQSLPELGAALDACLQNCDKVLIERLIKGREATVGVVNNFRELDVYVLPAVEIVPPTEFYDYTVKYDGSTQLLCPGRFSKTEKEQLTHAARTAHTVLGLSQYSRSDFIVAEDGVYFLEVNTLPGMTPTSLLPTALESVGVSYTAFLQHLLLDALRHPAEPI